MTSVYHGKYQVVNALPSGVGVEVRGETSRMPCPLNRVGSLQPSVGLVSVSFEAAELRK